nr:hypothetical protein [Rhodococcus sp. 06-621-2]
MSTYRYQRALFSSLMLVCAFVIAAIPPVVLYGPVGRIGPIFQGMANIALFLTVLSLLCSLDRRGISLLVNLSVRILFLICLVQVVFFGGRSAASGERFLGLIRPVGLFTEPTWVAMFAALLFSSCLCLRLRTSAWLSGLLVLIIFTRSALIVGVSALVVTLFVFATSRFFVGVLVAGCSSFSAIFVVRALQSDDRIASASSSLDTRQLDIYAVKIANGGYLSEWGSAVLRVFDPVRGRLVPGTSNVMYFDLYWKFGLLGSLVFAVWAFFFCWFLPRRYGASFKDPQALPVFVSMMLLPAVLQLNNAFGRPWLWVSFALLVSVIRVACDSGFEARSRNDSESTNRSIPACSVPGSSNAR